MKLQPIILCVAVIAGFVGIAAASGEPGPTATGTIAGSDDCCFTNPRYSGVCRVTPGPEETCSDILAYLNNQASVGKTYCGNTKVRGGWSQVDCDSEESVCVAPESKSRTETG
jgi:hypothetical protein